MTRTGVSILAAAALVLAALYAWLRPGDAEVVPAPPALPSGTAAPAIAAERPVATRLSVDAPSPIVLSARVGDDVVIEVQSSRPGELSAHGLAREDFPVAAGAVERITLHAAQSGRHALHFHRADGDHVPLAVLDIVAGP